MAETPKSPTDAVENPFPSKARAADLNENGYLFHRFEPLEFTGTTWSYFKIYFINIFLTLLTLGLYVPWARVRRRRYFYSNTRILGDGIDYLATGFDLLKGWLLVLAGLACFYALPFFDFGFAYAEAIFLVAVLFAYPWAMNKSLQFNARNIVWRDVRFTWHGSYWGVAANLFIAPLVGLLTLGLLLPLASRMMRHYIAKNYSFGSKRFEVTTNLWDFYKAGLKTVMLCLGIAFMIIMPLDLIYVNANSTLEQLDMNSHQFWIITIFVLQLLIVGLFLVTTSFYRAQTRNLMTNGLRLDNNIRFRSELSGLRLAWIVLQNAVLIVFSFSLLLPWAHVRYYRYLTENTYIRPYNDMTQFVDDEINAGHSIGDAVSEAAGLEIAL